MAELKKRKAKAGTETNGNKKMKNHKKSIRGNRKGDKLQKRRGPRLPSALRKELDRLNPKLQNSDGEIDSDEGNNDFYEYEEGVAEEESRKNQRFDRVENYEYQLPEDFEDEDVLSEDGDESDGAEGGGNKSDDEADGVEEDGDQRHRRMLQAVTGIPSEAFEGKKKTDDIFVSEAYPESEFNPTRDVLSGNSQITIQDLLIPLQGKPGYSRLRKRMQNVGKEFASIQAPLPISEQAKLERQAVYKQSKQEITKWEPIVKRNREAPTLYFDKNVDLGFSTVGAIASTFQPRTEFEKKMALLVSDNKVTEAHKEDGSKLLELNEISVEDYLKERNHIAKMRSFLFHHEIKSKRIKKIKSKTYHRLLKRDRSKAGSAEILMDPEAAKEHAKKREVERAKERMTLRHKGFSKWSRRIVERGLNTQDEGTRAALAEQFHQHALLTRKMDTINESTSSDSSSEDEDGESAGSDKDRALLAKAKEKTLKLSEDDHDLPKSGLLSLPFMVRGMKKRKDEAAEEARRAVQEYEQLEDADVARISREGTRSGRMVFGMSKNEVVGSNANYMVDDNNMKMDNFYGDSDSDKDVEANDNTDTGKGNDFEKDAGTSNVPEDSKNHQGSVFKNLDDIIRGPGPNTTYEVSVFAAGEWKKMNSGKMANNDIGRSPNVFEPVLNDENLENGEESDADSEVHNMVDGIRSSGPKESYVLPSQAELIRHAFAGDDVVEEFEKDKQEILNEENPAPEKPVLLPGWGHWTHVQQKKGLPSWMVKEHDDAKRRREAALKRRKDARLKHVIISEKLDKKAEKLQTKTLPYPFTSKEVFEGSMRVPIGPEFNPATAIGAITRPEVVKRAGVIIKPIQFEEVNAHARTDDQKGSHKERGKRRGAGGKIHKSPQKAQPCQLGWSLTRGSPTFSREGNHGPAPRRPDFRVTDTVLDSNAWLQDQFPFSRVNRRRLARMLHELLLSLLGYTGDLIIDERDHRKSLGLQLSPAAPISDERTFKLAPDVSFIDPSDKAIIERLITLGFYYRELDRFASKSRNLSWIRSADVAPLERVAQLSKGSNGSTSVYRRALANGIFEILSIYRSAVLHIEQKLLSETMPILAIVTQGLNKFLVILPPLYELILEIERDDIRGGQLLNFLHKRRHCGVPELQTCIQRLLWHGHQVMYNQLASWMVYGILHDQHGEFFIRRQEDRDAEHGSSNADVSEKHGRLSTHDTSLTDWQLGFHIALDMLPEYIHMRVAESILFSGKAIRVLRNPSPTFQSQDAVRQQVKKGSTKSQGFSGRLPFQKETFLGAKLMGEELIPQPEADKIEAMLRELKESSEFHRRSFESAVDSIRSIAASHLWQLVVVRADLNGHLKALKDYFLLAKGDFFQCFLEEGRQLMRLPPRQSTAEADLMVPFQLAAIKTISEEDRYFSRVSLRMPSFGIIKSSQVDLPKAKAHIDGSSGLALSGMSTEAFLDGWDGIALEYSVDWPLQLFFTQEVLSKYLRVFQYLLRLKRTQLELEKSWASVMHQDHTDFAKRRNERKNYPLSQQWRQHFRPMWHIREHMAFLIRNLQFYIQVDVIESQWNMLQSRVQDSHDFNDLVGFHQEYLLALISQSFLDIGSVSRILDSIMKLCLQFCWNLENQDSSQNTSELEKIAEEFNKKSNSLYTILRSSRLVGSQRAPFLRRFLLRLNFNMYFESTARGVLNIVRPRPEHPGLNQL